MPMIMLGMAVCWSLTWPKVAPVGDEHALGAVLLAVAGHAGDVAPGVVDARQERVPAPYGGSGLAIAKKIPDGKLDAAKKFVEYVTTDDEGIDARVSNGSFRATSKTLDRKDFLAKTTLRNADGSDNEFFGGQKYNEVFSQAAKDVTGKWEFLPFEPYTRSVYNDNMGLFFSGKTDFRTTAGKWQIALRNYAADQGFSVQ
ncbi:hypothetical protein ACR74G_08595 [Bifidobacterium longum subsp. infantis]|nr:hypothetical protein [Bifidobacterium longum]